VVQTSHVKTTAPNSSSIEDPSPKPSMMDPTLPSPSLPNPPVSDLILPSQPNSTENTPLFDPKVNLTSVQAPPLSSEPQTKKMGSMGRCHKRQFAGASHYGTRKGKTQSLC
jgi:hypothetical protein